MKVDRISHIPYSQRVGRYHFQMVQAKLSAPVAPVFGYSLQPYYTRQQQWMTDLSDSLSRLYRLFADLDQAAREFDPARPTSAIHQQAVVSSVPEAAVVQAHSQAANGTHRLRIVSLASRQSLTGKALPGDAPAVVADSPQQFVPGRDHAAGSPGREPITKKATDAVFWWDGTLHTSPSNQIALSDGAVQLSLLRAEANDIFIEIAPDVEFILRHTRTLVNIYNRLHAFLADPFSGWATQKLETFTRLAQATDGALGGYGLRVQPDGQIALHEATWREAVSADFSGFAKEMARLSRSLREEVIRVQSKPFASFARPYDAALSANPYERTTASAMQFCFAARTGLFFNQRW
ncbi:flagellar filament capping protein FliD [Brevibacillus sp. SAFN-007a]|uniref:flagellar filament capping protein FliD n=1 Tax=Brevibacillus sp. SAFN-007a TaxID=3436862 RepID=UPI003F80E411